ncbi:MAG: vitamin K-dependent gamma-carboxylase [Minisyncoccia bacterium]|jgi:vitamin K-dependent gamma-carboxylase
MAVAAELGHATTRCIPHHADSRRGNGLERRLSASSFVAFRIAFGLLVAVGQVRFIARGWVDELYLAPAEHLTYPGFSWVRPLPSTAMYIVVGALVVLGLLIAAGWRTRVCAAAFTAGFVYCELIDAALYLNHYWLITLAGLLLALLPTPVGGTVPLVNVLALRTQLGVVYFFAGLAKLNSDWLLRAEPLRTWLAARTDRPVIGGLLDEAWLAFGISWVGAVFDLTIVGWLLWRRSRPWAYVVLVVFHVATAMLFQIGMFPWVMIALTPIFFAPAWADRLLDSRQRNSRLPDGQLVRQLRRLPPGPMPRAIAASLVVLLAVNIALPLRHYLADGNVRWNDDGYLLSWRVLLTERAGTASFEVVDLVTGDQWEASLDHLLDDWQIAGALTSPTLLLAAAHMVADNAISNGHDSVAVYADAHVAWNGRLHQRWIDPDVDLARVSKFAPHGSFMLDPIWAGP